MKLKYLPLVLVLSCMSVFSYSQESDINDSTAQVDSVILVSYERQAKSKTLAVLLGYFLPSAGHAYAGDWPRGLLFTAGQLGGLVLTFAVGIDKLGLFGGSTEVNAWYYVGTLIVVGLKVWELFDAAALVQEYNDALFAKMVRDKSFTLRLFPVKDGMHFQLSHNF